MMEWSGVELRMGGKTRIEDVTDGVPDQSLSFWLTIIRGDKVQQPVYIPRFSVSPRFPLSPPFCPPFNQCYNAPIVNC